MNTAAITIDEITRKARLEEVVAEQARIIQQNNTQTKAASIAAMDNKRETSHQRDNQRYNRTKPKEDGGSRRCFYCGYDYPLKGACPAKERKCKVCNEKGHFSVSRYCNKRIRTIDQREDREETDQATGNTRDAYQFTIKSENSTRPVCNIRMEGSIIKILIDSGAGSNVIDEETFRGLKKAPILKQARTKIYAFNSEQAIPVVGEFETWIELEGKTCKDEFIVVKGSPGNLLSFKTARRLDAFNLEIRKKTRKMFQLI